jgi:hypothetical protein
LNSRITIDEVRVDILFYRALHGTMFAFTVMISSSMNYVSLFVIDLRVPFKRLVLDG